MIPEQRRGIGNAAGGFDLTLHPAQALQLGRALAADVEMRRARRGERAVDGIHEFLGQKMRCHERKYLRRLPSA